MKLRNNCEVFCTILGLVASSNVINTIATSEIFEDAIPEGFSTSKGVSDSETLADFDNGDEFVDTEKDANVQETATKDDSTETNGGNCIQACRRGGQEGAGTPPAFRLGEQGGKSALFNCNNLFSNC